MNKKIKDKLEAKIVNWKTQVITFENADYSNFQQRASNLAFAAAFSSVVREMEAFIKEYI